VGEIGLFSFSGNVPVLPQKSFIVTTTFSKIFLSIAMIKKVIIIVKVMLYHGMNPVYRTIPVQGA